MNSCKAILSICMQNIRKWCKDYRIWSIAILLIIIIQIYVDDIKNISSFLEADVPVWIFPFMYSQFYTKLLFTIPIILLFCNAPFIDDNQVYVYIRAGRRKWILGQILYIFLASAIYYLFIFFVSLLTTSIYGSFEMEWGKVLYTISETNIALQRNCLYVEVSSIILDYFTPLQAVWFTFVVSWSNAVLIGMIIFACNYLTKLKYFGISLSSMLIVFSCFVLNYGRPELIKYSPTSWITLDKIDIGGKTENPSFLYCICFYWLAIVGLIIVVFMFSKKKSVDLRR